MFICIFIVFLLPDDDLLSLNDNSNNKKKMNIFFERIY